MKNDKNKIIIGGMIIDGSGKEPESNKAIIIEGKYIKDIIEIEAVSDELKSTYEMFDMNGQYIMPGFIDTHTHIQLCGKQPEIQILKESIPKKTLRAAQNAKKTIEAGFTTIRDLGAEYLIDLGLRDAINEGLLVGPRMFVSGYKVMPTGADFALLSPEVDVRGRHTMDSPEEIKKGVRTLIARDVDVIKIMTSGRTFRENSSPDAYALSLEDTKLVVREAHNQNKKVSAHVHGQKGVKIALEARCDSLEHGTVLDDEDIETMVKHNIFLIPTFSYGKHIEVLGDNCGLPVYAINKALDSRQKRLKSFSKALKGGVKIAMGTDAGMPLVNHGENAFELETMVEAGMSIMQAIQSMTSCAAELLGQSEKIGTLTPGKLADIVIVEGDPLRDISILCHSENIKGVIKEGNIVVNKNLNRAIGTE